MTTSFTVVTKVFDHQKKIFSKVENIEYYAYFCNVN
jgi:uncharacterized membrane protein